MQTEDFAEELERILRGFDTPEKEQGGNSVTAEKKPLYNEEKSSGRTEEKMQKNEEKSSQTLTQKLEKYKKRLVHLFIWLAVECVVLWIIHPDFIPGLSVVGHKLYRFIEGILIPRDMSELVDGTYRAYIYEFWTGVKSMDIYPLLEWVVPRIVPVWIIVSFILTWVTKYKIKHPKKPKKRKEEKMQNNKGGNGIGIGPKVSAMHGINSENAVKRLRELQESCQPILRSDVCSLAVDRGIWVSNQAPGAAAKADKIYPWGANGTIDIPYKGKTLHVELHGDGAQLMGLDPEPIRLKKGVPLTVTHENEAHNEIMDMTITWLGGIV